MSAARLVLASQSPRRRGLLALITDDYRAVASDIDETPFRCLPACRQCAAAALAKARAVACAPEEAVIACDTVVAAGHRVLGKPADRAEAVAFIKLLSGRTHAVYTAVTVRWQGREYSFIERTLVRFCDIPEQEIERYADTPEPYDKAGGYGIQGRAAVWTTGISGCYYNVMGLPVAHLAAKLREIGAL